MIRENSERVTRLHQHVSHDERYELQDLLYPRRGPVMTREESIAHNARFDERLAELEAKYADAIEHARIERRRQYVQRFGFPITSDDEEALARRALKPSRSRKVVEAWWSSAKPLLVLTGSTGTGKTISACELLVQHGGAYLRATHLARLFLAQFGSEVEERDKLIDSLGLVVVDDIGIERGDSMQLALTEMIDRRRNRDRRTLWISNLSKSDFEARYPDQRLHSRLAQAAAWSVDAGEDRRRQPK